MLIHTVLCIANAQESKPLSYKFIGLRKSYMCLLNESLFFMCMLVESSTSVYGSDSSEAFRSGSGFKAAFREDWGPNLDKSFQWDTVLSARYLSFHFH
jgi:hypothetical protein